jgi:hypothetical protein
MDGFALGVQYYNQKNGADVEVLGWDPAKHEGLFLGGFCCAAEGRQITQGLLDQGADIILPVAGTNVGPGAAYAVQAHGDAFIIGVDTDWTLTNVEFTDIILTSILKNYDASVVQAVQGIEGRHLQRRHPGRHTGNRRGRSRPVPSVRLAHFVSSQSGTGTDPSGHHRWEDTDQALTKKPRGGNSARLFVNRKSQI